MVFLMVKMNEYLRFRMEMMNMKENKQTYTEDELVKVYRVAFEEGKREGSKEMMEAAGSLASGFISLKSLIEESYSTKPVMTSVDKPYHYEIERILKILKDGSND